MKALRIRLTQTSANYRKEETMGNKMTYPLPPPSTVIGALHKACGYTTPHFMEVSIQGGFGSMHREPYTDYCFLNSTMDDRGLLVKMQNGSLLSNAFDKVAKAKKPQGNSFRKNITIDVYNQTLLEEYQKLKDLSDEISLFKEQRIKKLMNWIKKRKEMLKNKKIKYVGDEIGYASIVNRERELKAIEKEINERMKNYEEENYAIPIAKFRSLITSLQFYEILDEIQLVLHVKAEGEVLQDIYENIFSLKAIGRSEDFVDVKDCEFVELQEELEQGERINEQSAYVDIDLVRNGKIVLCGTDYKEGYGTKYKLNTMYTIEKKQRIFKKVNVLYISNYSLDELSPEENLYADGSYIVNFLEGKDEYRRV